MQTTLNPNAQAWVDALRSGDYKRGQSALHEMTGSERDEPLFCCLGVACDLFAKAHPDQGRWIATSPIPHGAFMFETATSRSQMHLTIEVSDWLGLKRQGPLASEGNDYGEFERAELDYETDLAIMQTLATLNDEKDFSFKQIADVIESQPKGLFNA